MDIKPFKTRLESSHQRVRMIKKLWKIKIANESGEIFIGDSLRRLNEELTKEMETKDGLRFVINESNGAKGLLDAIKMDISYEKYQYVFVKLPNLIDGPLMMSYAYLFYQKYADVGFFKYGPNTFYLKGMITGNNLNLSAKDISKLEKYITADRDLFLFSLKTLESDKYVDFEKHLTPQICGANIARVNYYSRVKELLKKLRNTKNFKESRKTLIDEFIEKN